MKKLSYYAWWYLKCRLLGRKIPLQSVVFITTKCNLQCKHCAIAKKVSSGSLRAKDLKYAKVMEMMRYCYNKGSRIIDFEGGEPLLWNDEGYGVDDLIEESRKMGFFCSTITTNGTLPIKTRADLVWVSVDGTREIHDEIRGQGVFDRLMRNVKNSFHPRIYANMVINTINWKVVEDTIRLIAQTPNFRGISLNFHTPHSGVEELFLPWEQRQEVLGRIINLKKQNFPIINSLAGLKLLYSNNWKRRCWISNFALPDGTILDECPGSQEGICDRCGYGMGTEMSAVFDLRFSTIKEAIHLFS